MSHFQSLEAAREYFRKDTFAMNNDMALEELTEDGAVCSMAVTERHQNAEGGLMGGAILALAGFTFAAAAHNAHHPTVAQQVSMNFLNASRGTRLTSTAACVKDGRTSCVYLVNIKDDLGRDIAQFTGLGCKLPPRE